MYIVIEGSKGSYDRPIELSMIGCYDNEEDASKVMKRYLPLYKEGLEEAVNNKKEYYQEGAFDYPIYFGYSKSSNLIHFSTGCPADNEYDGETYSIFEVGE